MPKRNGLLATLGLNVRRQPDFLKKGTKTSTLLVFCQNV